MEGGPWHRPGKVSPALSTPMVCLLSRCPVEEMEKAHHGSSVTAAHEGPSQTPRSKPEGLLGTRSIRGCMSS